MRRTTILAGAAAILIVAGHAATTAAPQLRLPQPPNRHADLAIQPVVVMFNLAILRRHMLDTLTELIGSAAPSRSPQASCAARAGSAPGSAGSRLSPDPPAQC